VDIVAGFILFPAALPTASRSTAGPSLLFDTMAPCSQHGRRPCVGHLFFLFMVFAAFSTELAVFENILACIRELTGWSRKKGCIACGIGIFILALTTALGYSVFHFQPFAEGTAWLDFWDFIVSTNLLPLGALIFSVFCCYRIGWGWDKFIEEANAGKGMKVKTWMKPIFKYVVPVCVLGLYIYGLVTFKWK
jgi:NSS family neurotransmitter:Na+ symporter